MKKRTFGKVLSFCNVVRKRMGKRPVKVLKRGVPNTVAFCPVALTIGGATAVYTVITVDKANFRTTAYVESFMRDFDDLKYPELVKEMDYEPRKTS